MGLGKAFSNIIARLLFLGISEVEVILNDRAQLGTWRIYAEVDGKKEERSFQVKVYGEKG